MGRATTIVLAGVTVITGTTAITGIGVTTAIATTTGITADYHPRNCGTPAGLIRINLVLPWSHIRKQDGAGAPRLDPRAASVKNCAGD